jgi:hypothetical protein
MTGTLSEQHPASWPTFDAGETRRYALGQKHWTALR